jgi:hypothetical protein
MTTAATTKLEAVNVILSTIGEAPFNTLTGPLTADAAIAVSTLDEITKEVLMRGWDFNTEDEVSLAPDMDGFIAVPANVCTIDVEASQDTNIDVTTRDGRLYDRKSHGFVFGGPVKANVTYLFTFEQIPEAARRYIMVRAARVFADRQVGDTVRHRFTEMDEARALSDLSAHEADTGDHTIFDNWSVARVIARGNPNGTAF